MSEAIVRMGISAALAIGLLVSTGAGAQPLTSADVSLGVNDSDPSNFRLSVDGDPTFAETLDAALGFSGVERALADYGVLRAYSELSLSAFPYDQIYGNATATFFDDLYIASSNTSSLAVMEFVYTVDGTFGYGSLWDETVRLYVNGLPYEVLFDGQVIRHRNLVNLNDVNIISGQLTLHVEGREGMTGTSVLDFEHSAVLTELNLYELNGIFPIVDFSVSSASGTAYPIRVPEPGGLTTAALVLVLGLRAGLRRAQ